MGGSGASENLKFSEFIDAVTSNKVASVTIRGDVIEGKFASPQLASDPALAAANRTFSEFKTTFRSAVTPSPEELLLKHKVKVSIEPLEYLGDIDKIILKNVYVCNERLD